MCGRCTRKGAGTSSQPATAFVSNMKISLGKSEFKTSCDSGQSPSNATEFFFYTALKKSIPGNCFGICAQWTKDGKLSRTPSGCSQGSQF